MKIHQFPELCKSQCSVLTKCNFFTALFMGIMRGIMKGEDRALRKVGGYNRKENLQIKFIIFFYEFSLQSVQKGFYISSLIYCNFVYL